MGNRWMRSVNSRTMLFFQVVILLFAAALIGPNFDQSWYVTAGQKTEALGVDVVVLPNVSVKGAKKDARNLMRLAILSRDGFDALKVDPSTVTFAGAAISQDGTGRYSVFAEDVDGNGLDDLVVTFAREDLQVGKEPTKADFRGRTFDGVSIEGHQCAQASGEPCGGTVVAPSATGTRTLMKKTKLKPIGGDAPNFIQAVIFSENFDAVVAPALPAGWTASFINWGTRCAFCNPGTNWTTVNTSSDTATNSAFHGDPSCVSDSLLDSPTIAITTGASRLTFRHQFDLESTFDGGVLEISIGGGAFTDIVAAGGSFAQSGYTATISTEFASPIPNRMAWSGNSGGYITTVANLPAAAAGQNVKLRWRLATDCSNASTPTGWNVDTISIEDCSVTCPANVIQANDPNLCSAVVNYPAATTPAGCGTATCAPASGSIFPVGTTTVTCTSTAGPTCTFTVTVNDTQPPTITCPAPVTTVAAQTCPLSTSTVVTFPAPTASDNCPGVVTVCNPPSGSTFPIGTTTVTCTATDASGNTATCSFTVTAFSACLQDDSVPTNVMLFSPSGAYTFCCNGMTFSGTGIATVRGCVVTIQDNRPDRRVLLTFDGALHRGTASLQNPPGTTKCTITDRNTLNNTCACQ